MKSAVLAVVGAALVAAQDISSLPACGQQCATAMLSAEKAEELGCSAGDTQCLCSNPNFMFGLRDCSNPNCPINEALQIVAFGVQLCSDEGIVITDGGSSQITGTAGDSVSTVYSTLTSDGEAVTTAVDTTTLGGGAGGSGGSVSTVYSTLTSDGEAVTTAVATTTLGGAEDSQSGSMTDATGSSSNGGAPVLVSTLTSDGSVITTTLSTVTPPDPSGPATASQSASTSGGSGGDGGDGGDSTATDGASETSNGGDGGEGGGDATSTEADDAALPQRTAAPGLLAAAGLVALLL